MDERTRHQHHEQHMHVYILGHLLDLHDGHVYIAACYVARTDVAVTCSLLTVQLPTTKSKAKTHAVRLRKKNSRLLKQKSSRVPVVNSIGMRQCPSTHALCTHVAFYRIARIPTWFASTCMMYVQTERWFSETIIAKCFVDLWFDNAFGGTCGSQGCPQHWREKTHTKRTVCTTMVCTLLLFYSYDMALALECSVKLLVTRGYGFL